MRSSGSPARQEAAVSLAGVRQRRPLAFLGGGWTNSFTEY